jgi:LEA14-like dessication related protein
MRWDYLQVFGWERVSFCVVAESRNFMMRRTLLRRIIYPFLLLFLLLSGCTKFVNEPVVKVKDLSVVSLDGGGAVMELYLNVKNTNSFDIKLQGYSYDLKVMALPLAKGGAREEIKFPSEGDTDLRIPIRIGYNDLFQILKRRPDPDHIPYQLAAGLDLDTPVGQMTVPVNSSGTYAIPKEYRPSTILNMMTEFFKLSR